MRSFTHQGVPRHKKEAVRKNEEIQALDYVFNVDSVRHSRASEWEETQSLAPSESRETGEAQLLPANMT